MDLTDDDATDAVILAMLDRPDLASAIADQLDDGEADDPEGSED